MVLAFEKYPAAPWPRIGVLILNRNGKDWLPGLYESLRKEGYANGRVYLVDNASDDGSVEMTLQRYPEVIVIRMPQNLGYCMAYNLAMPYAFGDGCEWVIWANNDIRVEPGCLAEMVHAAQFDPGIGVLGPGFLAWEKDEPNYYMVGNHPYAIPAMQSKSRKPIDVDWVEGSFLMVSRRCVEAVGPLDPYFYSYWEEADFCQRARFQDWRVALMPSALARHFGGGSSIGDPINTATTNQLGVRNHYIYKLANPFRGFSRNFLNAFYLFLVHLHFHFPKQLSMIQWHTRIFLGVLQDIRTIHYKRLRDLKGEHPPRVAGPFWALSAEVIQAPSRR